MPHHRGAAIDHQELADGIAAGDLRMRLQPLIGAHSRRCVGFEALVRWQHRTRGLLSPSEFVPLAEDGPLIAPLTDWVLEEAVRACAEWRGNGHPLGVSVNLSARLLADAGMPARVEETLLRHGLAADALTLELTESALFERPEEAVGVLRGLRRRGIRVSIDDFGTGFTSLAILKRFELDELKIDRTFVAPMLASPADAAIVRSILELGHRLGLDVVAEGVEDEPTARLLAELGCDVLQGFHFRKPVDPVDALTEASGVTAPAGDGATSPSAALAARPVGEVARLVVLRSLDILDSDPEVTYDDVAGVAATVCATPIGLVTFIDDDRQWFKACVGITATEGDRDTAFCAHAILGDGVMEVPDLAADSRFAAHPLVRGEPGLRFYAGVPLVTNDDHAVGTLCVMDTIPRSLTDAQRSVLARLAKVIVGALLARRNELALKRLSSSLAGLAELTGPADVPDAAAAISHVTRELLGADGALVLLSEAAGAVHLKPVGTAISEEAMPRALALIVDVRTDPAVAEVMTCRRPLFVADAVASPLVDASVRDAFDIASALYLPISNEGGVEGVLMAWWAYPVKELDAVGAEAAQLLATEAGTTLSRLHALAVVRRAGETDALTEMPNRRAGLAALRQLPSGSAVALADVDHLADVNEQHGQQAGDQTIRAFASLLSSGVSAGGLVSRWDGDELLVGLAGRDDGAAIELFSHLRTQWAPPVSATTFSAGVAILQPGETASSVLARAERALATAKTLGGDRTVAAKECAAK